MLVCFWMLVAMYLHYQPRDLVPKPPNTTSQTSARWVTSAVSFSILSSLRFHPDTARSYLTEGFSKPAAESYSHPSATSPWIMPSSEAESPR